MILKPTTLLLGAGASAHLGYPVGAELRDQMLRVLQPERFREMGSLAVEVPTQATEVQREDFFNHLSRGGWSSPDAYLEKYPKHLELGKWLIAALLKKHEDPDKLFYPHRNGWYGILGNALDAGTPDEFRKNRLSIVTFNYDRSIECFLHNMVKYKYHFTDADAWKLVNETIRIVHVHGTLGGYPEATYSPQGDIQAAAQGIKIIFEFEDKEDEFCSDEFKAANQVLDAAENIFIIGFSMAETNIRRLRFFNDENLKKRKVSAAFGSMGNIAYMELQNRANATGFGKINLHRTDSETLFVDFVSLTA